MNLYELQKSPSNITTYLKEKEKEDKAIQIIDLKAFISCHDNNIKIIDYKESKINVIEQNGNKKRVLFCELNRVSDLLNFYETFYDIYNSEKKESEEIWCVFVEEFATNNFDQFIDFIEENNLSSLFDKIFLFQFFKSTVHQLK